MMRMLWLLGFALVGACGSSGTDGTAQDTSPTGAACTSAQECNPQECVCNDGQTYSSGAVCSGGVCLTGYSDAFCASACKSGGGVREIRPSRNVAASSECDDWCSKGAALGCTSKFCDRYFFCAVPKGSCEAATRAALKCAVDQGKWACSTHGDAWSVTSSCGTFASLCDDAGAQP